MIKHVKHVKCIEAKHRRTIFANNRVKAKRSLQIVHTDVCGPINPDTWDGNRYFITFLDDYSLYNSVSYEIQEWSSKEDYISKDYISKAEARWNLKIAKLRCGREYINNLMTSWCKNKEIEIDTTIPHTSQLNSRAEWLNRILMEKVTALLLILE